MKVGLSFYLMNEVTPPGQVAVQEGFMTVLAIALTNHGSGMVFVTMDQGGDGSQMQCL